MVRISMPRPVPSTSGMLVVRPVVDVVERVAFQQQPLGRVAVVVQHDDDRVEAVPGDRRQLHAGHLERPVADDHQHPELGFASPAPTAAGTAKPIDV